MRDVLKLVAYVGIFAVPFVVLLVTDSLFFPYITGKNFAFRIIVEIMFAAWVLLAFYESQYRPRFSWILAAFAGLLGVMFFANLLGEYPLKSFWSNFERMDGYVTLAHLFLYFVVTGSVLTTDKLWNYFFGTTLTAAALSVLFAFTPLAGDASGSRLAGTLGNPTYMAIYMFFHIFIAALLFVRTEHRMVRYVCVGLIALFTLILLQTGTRGTLLGLVGGVFLSSAYFVLFAKAYPRVRRYALGLLVGLIIAVGMFVAFRDSTFIRNSELLDRFADITLEAGKTRFTIWGMALEGVKDRPVLGWGQENFNYVFNTYYEPSLYDQETWFDRVHNIVLDWLIAGGIVGAFFYFSILAATVYYTALRPLLQRDTERAFTAEYGLLFGLLGGYTIHNLFVFDNIVSYIFFAVILAFIHTRVSTSVPWLVRYQMSDRVVTNIALPVAGVVLAAAVYTVNVPHILAAKDIIEALRLRQSPPQQMVQFEAALARGSFADQEIREQMLQAAVAVSRRGNVPEGVQTDVFARAEHTFLTGIKEKPGDARLHLLMGSLYRAYGDNEKALAQLRTAQELSPKKQLLMFERGLVHLQEENFDTALTVFKEAYELAPEYDEAREFYALGAIYAGAYAVTDELIATRAQQVSFARNNLVVRSLYELKEYEQLQELLAIRVEENPADKDAWVSLAALYQEIGNIAKAVEVLRDAVRAAPDFQAEGEQMIKQLRGELQ